MIGLLDGGVEGYAIKKVSPVHTNGKRTTILSDLRKQAGEWQLESEVMKKKRRSRFI
jgi:hypothetical protein